MIKLINKIMITFIIISLNFFSAQAQNSLDATKIEQYLSTLPLLAQLQEKNIASDNDEKSRNSHTFDKTKISSTPITDNLIFL